MTHSGHSKAVQWTRCFAWTIMSVDYILGVRERSTKEVRGEVIEDDGVTIPLVIPRQRGETQLEIKDVTLRGRRYVLCRNEEEARKDAERRAMLIAGLERKLKEGDKALVGNKGFRRFVKSGPDKFSLDYEKAERRKVRRHLRAAHQHQIIGSGRRSSLSQFAGG
jgi:hypothetical protein